MSVRSKTGGTEFEGPRKSTKYQVDAVSDTSVKIDPLGSSVGSLELPTNLFRIRPRKGHIVKLDVVVEDPYTRTDWASAFAEQGSSDLLVYEILSEANVPSCHRLHYLQMATEKIAKAYQVAGGHWSPRKKSHSVAVEFVKLYYNSPSMKKQYDHNREQFTILRGEMMILAEKIQKLAPAVDDENVPENVEYPWATSERLEVPCKHKFPIEDLPERQINAFVQMLKDVAGEKLQHPS